MNLKSHIDKLGLQPTLNKVVNKLDPVAVVCFGVTISQVECLNCFHTAVWNKPQIDLLIVQSTSCPNRNHEVIDHVKNIFTEQISINVVAHREASVIKELQFGHPFFTKVFQHGYILYQKGEPFVIASTPNMSPFQTVNDWEQPLKLAENFLKLANASIGNKIDGLGVFLIHQAIEQMGIASINVHLGYRMTSHSIKKSIELISCYIPQVRELFPCNTKLEKELFNYLCKAYSDVRYKADYSIPTFIVLSLMDRAIELMKLIKTSYQNEFGNSSE